MCAFFNTKTDKAQNLIEDIFLTLTVRGPFHRKDSNCKKIGGYGVNKQKYAELNERAEAATDSYSVTSDSLHYIYSVLVTKNHRNIQSRRLVREFFFTNIFLKILISYKADILKKNVLWLLLFYMVVATYFYYEKVRRMMRTAIVSNLLNT